MEQYFEAVKTLNKIAPDKHFLIFQKFFSVLAYQLADLLPPIATAGIITVLTEGKPFSAIWFYVFIYVASNVLYYSLYLWTMYTYTRLAIYYHNTVQGLLFRHISENHTIFDKFSQGKINDTIADDVRYLVDVVDSAAHVAASIIQLLVIFSIFIYHNVFVGIIAAAVDITFIVLMNNNSKKVAKYYDGTRKYEDKIINILTQLLGNLKQVKSLNIMPSLERRLEKTGVSWRAQYKKKRRTLMIRKGVMPGIIYGGEILMYVLLGYLVVHNQMTLDKLVLLTSYFSLTISYTESLLTYALDLSQYTVRVTRIKNILDYTADGTIDYGDINNDYIEGSVVFDRVNYSTADKDILKNISFKAYPNEITAIIGKPGSGKSTILNLLYRLNRIKSGSILLDDESIYNYTKKVYASNVSGVFQHPFTFRISIADNLALVDPDRKHQEAACRRVGIHQLITKLPKGYNTIIDDTHEYLAPDQLQLLAIARALLSRSEVLLFDEIETDSAFASRLAEVLEDLKEDHTIIIVTNYDEIIKVADRIVYMKDGKVLKKGRRSELIKKSKS